MRTGSVTSIRLRPDQIAKLPKGLGAKIIRRAVERYRRGEITIPRNTKKEVAENGKEVLQVFAFRGRISIGDARLRQILDAHFEHPTDHSREFEYWNRIAEEMLKSLPPVILE